MTRSNPNISMAIPEYRATDLKPEFFFFFSSNGMDFQVQFSMLD